MRMRTLIGWMGAAALAGLALATVTPARAAGLTLLRPKDGDTVRETVKVVVPRSSIPPNGFASLFIDGLFRVAQTTTPGSSKPVTFFWDTKAKLPDPNLPENKRVVEDGEHAVEVRTYTDDGRMAERTSVNVNVANRVPIRKGQPIYLGYRFKVGDSTKYSYTYDLKAAGTQNAAGAGPTTLPEINYKEFSKLALFVEDVNAGEAFMRERRFSPVTVSYGDVPQSVPIDESSRYFEARPNGNTIPSSAMTREKRTPFFGPVYLPARSVPVGASWRGPVMIWGGAFSTNPMVLMATNTLEAVEWEHGVPTARIKSTYKGKEKISNSFAGIPSAQIEVTGTSTFYYAPSSGKIVRAVHEMDGKLLIDTNQAGAGGGSPGYGGPGGAPGYGGGAPGYGGPPGGSPGYGGPPGGAPGYSAPGGAPGYATPGGPPGYGGGPGGAPGYGGPGGGSVYDPSANAGGPIPGVPVYATYSLKIRAVATVA
jgi:hypothetical protein